MGVVLFMELLLYLLDLNFQFAVRVAARLRLVLGNEIATRAATFALLWYSCENIGLPVMVSCSAWGSVFERLVNAMFMC